MTNTAREVRPAILQRNHLLAGLREDEQERLLSLLQPVMLRPKEVLYKPGETVRRVYFPLSGIFSVTRPMADGTMVEAAPVGREGMLGIEVYLAPEGIATGQTLLQVPDGQALAMPADAFRHHLRTNPHFNRLVGRYVEAFVATVMQSAACNALHEMRPRCARWFLMAHDRVDGQEFRLSHEGLATLLGGTRPTVTTAALKLQEEGLITYTHGRVRVLNRSGLEAAACECYGIIREYFTYPTD